MVGSFCVPLLGISKNLW